MLLVAEMFPSLELLEFAVQYRGKDREPPGPVTHLPSPYSGFDNAEQGDESESDEDEDMEPAPLPSAAGQSQAQQQQRAYVPPVVGAAHTPSDVDMLTPGGVPAEEGSEAEEDDGLFAGGDEEEEESGDEAMEDVTASGAGDAATNGVKRKLVEEEDYD